MREIDKYSTADVDKQTVVQKKAREFIHTTNLPLSKLVSQTIQVVLAKTTQTTARRASTQSKTINPRTKEARKKKREERSCLYKTQVTVLKYIVFVRVAIFRSLLQPSVSVRTKNFSQSWL